ncbi:unnamed protein product [Knipowitschia caucasica]|uniref:CBM21 domain-containing protein n=1 Tax=Knipowitschia caucasica TaxID=637954 RepID=A0AAV2J1P3_KNICA
MAVHFTRMLRAPSTLMMPSVDLAACLSLRQPLHPPTRGTTAQRLSPVANTSYAFHPLLYHPSRSPSPTNACPSAPRSCLRREHGGLRKRVSFADAKGMALTAVRLFIPDTTSSVGQHYNIMPSSVLRRFQAKQETGVSAKSPAYKLRLAFTQPSLDYNVFVSRQKETGLQLESCNVSESCVSGRVRVSPVEMEQNVHVRISFDSWRSHHDIPCAFLQTQRLGGQETDIYAFELSLPMNLDRIHGIEFCVTLGTDDVLLWDNNRGKNYRIHVEKDASVEQVEVAQGSPKMSRYQRLPMLAQMTPVDVRSYAEMPHLRPFMHMGVERGMCAVK